MERVLVDAGLRQRPRAGIEALAGHWLSWEVGIDRTIQAINASRVAA
jgi:hypothetical protein